MITQEELNNGLEIVKNDGSFKLFHPVFKECAMIQIGNEIALCMGPIVIYFDHVRLSNDLLKFMMNGVEVACINPQDFIVDNWEVA